MVYIQSGYLPKDREQYLTSNRNGRGFGLTKAQREDCLWVLSAWQEWLSVGGLCDVAGLSERVAELFDEPSRVEAAQAAIPIHHLLVDEAQDFSTLELRILRRLVIDPNGPNRFFLVGDLNQKVFPKHLNGTRAGFHFTGRSRNLTNNFRNTKQILVAAARLPAASPPQGDAVADLLPPELSRYEGERRVVLECDNANHVSRVYEIARVRVNNGTRVAVVSEREELLCGVRMRVEQDGLPCFDLFRVEDLDRWRQQGNGLRAGLVLSRFEAVKGFEFDRVLMCGLTSGVVPAPGTPREEEWRSAELVYVALTRARDELIITYVGRPSKFLETMRSEVEWHDGEVTQHLRKALRIDVIP